jgi:hypothetical protein
MTSKAESKILTETGPGTAMGEMIRQYWLPALKSSELVADGDPVRLMLLGEKLIAFRDSSGRAGSWITAARTVARRSFSPATRKTASAASITAGSTTWTAIAWTWPTCPRTRTLNTK